MYTGNIQNVGQEVKELQTILNAKPLEMFLQSNLIRRVL